MIAVLKRRGVVSGRMAEGLKVAVTGPTGDIGRATLRALDAAPEIGRILGMARRPFDPASHGLSGKVSYVRGDVLDRAAAERLVGDADVVMHLAFIIFGKPQEAQPINLEGSRNVFEAAVEGGAKRLIYTSSVAAYGFHEDNPQPLTEDVAPRGSDGFYYSAHKAELEALLDEVTQGADIDAYVFRPSIVAGRDAPAFLEATVSSLPIYGQLPLVRKFVAEVPFLAPVLPDPGLPFQLVHHDDVAAALVAATLGRGKPGRYNLAAEDPIRIADVARALSWWSVPVPEGLIGTLDELADRIPRAPVQLAWLTAARVPVLMDCAKAREELGWDPAYDGAGTLADLIAGGRERELV